MAELNEAVADVAEEVAVQALDVAEVSRSLSGRDFTIGLVVGLAIGGGLGFWWTRRNLETKYERIAEEEIDAMREHFRKKAMVKEEKPPLEQLDKKVSDLQYQEGPSKYTEAEQEAIDQANVDNPTDPTHPAAEREMPQVFSIVEDTSISDEGWDYKAELAQRTPTKPYVIHVDEVAETDAESMSLTYYEGDNVLCDENDKIIDDPNRVVGLDNLNKFGHGSKDKNLVWVRNEALDLDIEIFRNPDNYAEVVHGLTHEDTPRRRKPTWDE
jgi:hypothetical protein